MLTCEQVKEQVEEITNGKRFDLSECVPIAMQIYEPVQIPEFTDRNKAEKAIQEFAHLPEAAEAQRGMTFYQGDDHSDLIVHLVTLWQFNKAMLADVAAKGKRPLLTCEQIVEQLRLLAGGQEITPDNYSHFAELIHPLTPLAVVDPTHRTFELIRELSDLPEAAEARRGARWFTNDWTDLVVGSVTGWQRNAAYTAFLAKRFPETSSTSFEKSLDTLKLI